MKRLIILGSVLFAFFSCKDSGGFSGSEVSELKNEDEKAAYSYGINLGNQVERVKNAPVFKEDSLDIDELVRGMNDYFANSSNKKLSHYFGQSLAQQVENFIKSQDLEDTDFNKDIVIQALLSAANKDSLLIPTDSAGLILSNYQRSLQDKKKTKNLEESTKYLAEIEKKESVTKTESGLLYEVITEGEGANPTDEDMIKANYEGKLKDGTVFDSTEKNNNTPIELKVNQFVPGFSEGLKLMKKGAKYKFYIPPVLAYGERGAPGAQIEANEALVFEVELLDINPEQAKPEAAKPAEKPAGK